MPTSKTRPPVPKLVSRLPLRCSATAPATRVAADPRVAGDDDLAVALDRHGARRLRVVPANFVATVPLLPKPVSRLPSHLKRASLKAVEAAESAGDRDDLAVALQGHRGGAAVEPGQRHLAVAAEAGVEHAGRRCGGGQVVVEDGQHRARQRAERGAAARLRQRSRTVRSGSSMSLAITGTVTSFGLSSPSAKCTVVSTVR